LERGVRPIGRWAISLTRSILSRPSTRSHGAASNAEPLSYEVACPNRVSIIRVDLPDPETPVTHVNKPTGTSAVTFRRLLPVAPTMRITLPGSGLVRSRGNAIWRLPLRY